MPRNCLKSRGGEQGGTWASGRPISPIREPPRFWPSPIGKWGYFPSHGRFGRVMGIWRNRDFPLGRGFMTLVGEYLTVKRAARFLGVAENTMRNWDMAGAVPVHRDPKNKYRLFAVADLERIRKEIQTTGTYPTGWQRPRWPR